VCDAWSCADDAESPSPDPIGLLIVSGDEAAANPDVRALAEKAERVIAISMFQSLAAGWADLILPGTSYLERDGTYVNLEGRVQRLRRTVIPPVPDELAWIAKLAERFEIELSPYPSMVFEEVSSIAFGGIPFVELGERAPLPTATETSRPIDLPGQAQPGAGLRLVRYRPLFSGPAVERTPELGFQRPQPEAELSEHDARARGIANGGDVTISSNGTSVTLRARVSRELRAGVVRVADEYAGELQPIVEISA
jgi:NADH-quinone oxidoreductase subunit G